MDVFAAEIRYISTHPKWNMCLNYVLLKKCSSAQLVSATGQNSSLTGLSLLLCSLSRPVNSAPFLFSQLQIAHLMLISYLVNSCIVIRNPSERIWILSTNSSPPLGKQLCSLLTANQQTHLHTENTDSIFQFYYTT